VAPEVRARFKDQQADKWTWPPFSLSLLLLRITGHLHCW